MRLVIQRMMEHIQFQLRRRVNDREKGEEGLGSEEDDGCFEELAAAFFPDVFRYNALIEARANRSAMLASSDTKERWEQKGQQQQWQFLPPGFHT